MNKVLLVNEADIRRAVPLDMEAVMCMEKCFHSQSTEAIVMPPILQLDLEEQNGGVCIKTAYLPSFDSFAVKISPGFYDNPKIGLPTTSGMMNLFSSKTGMLESVLLDNGYLTDVRTAAAGALAAKWLSRQNSHSIAIIGSGAQARYQLEAIKLVREIDNISIWARDSDKAMAFAKDVREKYGIEPTVAESASNACQEADIVVTTTASTSPVIAFADLNPGQLVIAMGSDYSGKQELAVDVLSNSNRYVCDKLSQVRTLGELHHAIDAGAIPEDSVFDELGDIIAGNAPGRTNDNELIVCDLTGTGAQDTAISNFALHRAQKNSAGMLF